MKLDPVLLDILVCPDCKGSLTVDYDNDELICNQCGLIYPVRDDIPVMLVDEARRPQPRRTAASQPDTDAEPTDLATDAAPAGTAETAGPDESVGAPEPPRSPAS